MHTIMPGFCLVVVVVWLFCCCGGWLFFALFCCCLMGAKGPDSCLCDRYFVG